MSITSTRLLDSYEKAKDWFICLSCGIMDKRPGETEPSCRVCVGRRLLPVRNLADALEQCYKLIQEEDT